jgi:hypothetical protein
MNTKLLNEINRINSIMLGENVILEQASSVSLLKKIFSSVDEKTLRKILKNTDDDVIESVNKIKKGESISDNRIIRLLASVDYDLLSKNLIDNKVFGSEFNKQIDNLIIRINSGKIPYDKELNIFFEKMDNAFTLYPDEVIKGLKKEVKRRVDDAVSVRGTSKKVLAGFSEGFKAPSVYRNMIKNTRKLRWPTKDFTPDEYKRLLMWLGTGSTRLPLEMITLIRKHGLTSFASSFAGEALKRYLYLTGMLTGLNFIRQLLSDNITPEAERNTDNAKFLKNLLQVAYETLMFPDLQWVIPALVTWDALITVIGPISAGTGLKGISESITSKINELQNKKEELIRRTKSSTNQETQTPTLDGAKKAAPDDVKNFFWQNNDGEILYRGYNDDNEITDYLITLEDGEYYVDLGTSKIKVSEI